MTQLLVPKEDPALSGEESVRQFLSELRYIPSLSLEEERELAKRCAQADADAMRTLVNGNLRLVVSIAKEYARMGVPFLDLIQDGSMGLLEAASRFDYTLSVRFSTYATKWVRFAMRRSVMDKGLIRIPAYTADRIRKLMAVRNQLVQQTGEEPTIAQLSQVAQMPQDKVEELMKLNPEIMSLDESADPEDGNPIVGALEDLRTPQPYEELIREELYTTIHNLLGKLSARQRMVLSLRFGMEDGVCHSLEEIGEQLHITKEGARQLESRAIARLKEMGADIGLEDFLNV